MPPWVHLGDEEDSARNEDEDDLLREPMGGGSPSAVASFLEGAFLSPPKWVVVAVLAVAHSLASTSYVVSKPSLEHLPPASFALLQIVCGLPILGALAHLEQGRALRDPQGGAMADGITSTTAALTFICGILGGTIPVCLFWAGTYLQGPAQAAILQAGVPVWVLVFGAMFRVEQFSWQKALGLLAVVGGTVAMFGLDEGWGGRASQLVGTAFLVASALSAAGAGVMVRTSLRKFHLELPCTLALMCGVWACVGLLPLAFRSLMIMQLPAVPASAWGAMIGCTFSISVALPLCSAWAVQHVGHNMADALVGIQPLVAVPLASALASSGAYSPFEIGGLALILIGMLVVVISRHLEEGSPQQQGSLGSSTRAAADGYGRMDNGVEPSHFELSTTFLEEGGSLHDSSVAGDSPTRGIDPFNTPMCIASSLRSAQSSANALPPVAETSNGA